jgi:glycosyltransferase involved in cell wall biosynthesis
MEGLRDIARDGETAIVVEPGRPDELAVGITKVLEDAVLAERLTAGGAAEFTRRFTMERYVEGMVAIYERVAGG